MTRHGASVSSDPDIVAAILDDRLSSWATDVVAGPSADADRRRLADHALRTCRTIHATVNDERRRLEAALTDARIDVERSSTSDQRPSITFDVPPADAPSAAAVLELHGYHRPTAWTRGAERSFWRTAEQVAMTRTADDGATFMVRVRWRRPAGGSARRTARRLFVPTPADWATIDLPAPAWWLYPLVRPIRLVAERIGLRSRAHGAHEPFLATPDGLLEPIFDVADVAADDVVADIGCGDGRIVIAAARNRGCRAVGVERSPSSATRASAAVSGAGLDDRVRIVEGDVLDPEVVRALDDVTVAILFLPMVVAARVLPVLRARLGAGARIVVHEQSRLAADLPPPASTHAVVADQSVTVAHCWTV